jgi:hypothetical protein
VTDIDMVNHPPHYTRGPKITRQATFNIVGDKAITTFIVECIEVIRHISDMRLATAMKYIWRVAFGGKDNDREDIEKAIFYLKDWLDNPIENRYIPMTFTPKGPGRIVGVGENE